MDIASANVLIEKIKKLEQNIKSKIIQYNCMNMTYAVIIGITGCGKSSLTCCMANKKVMICKGQGNKIYLDGDGIVSGLQSGTKEPSIIVDPSSNLIFCDCPGFDDTEGYAQEIINSFIIDYLFKTSSNNKFKILLVISASQIESARGQSVFQSVERMQKMFPNPKELEKGLGLVISKGENGLEGKDYIEQLEDKCDPKFERWCNFFKSNLDHVFVFPKGSQNNVGQTYDFNDHERLRKFLQFNQIINISHKIALSENATLYVRNMSNTLHQEINNICKNIFGKISDEYRNEYNSCSFQKWINRLNQLSNLYINKIDDLINFFKQNVPNCYKYYDLLDGIKKLDLLYFFISQILDGYNNFSFLKETIKKFTNDNITELNYKYSQAKMNEDRERERIEYQRQMEIKRIEEERRRKEEEELRRRLEIQRQEEEKQKKKMYLLCRIRALQGRMRFWIEEGWPNLADEDRREIANLERQVASL